MPYTVPKLKDFSAKALDKASEKLLAALATESKAVKNADDLKTFRDRWMARKDGVLTQINDLWLKAAPKEAKREVGQRVNAIKQTVELKVETVSAATPSRRPQVFNESIRVETGVEL
jgi:phenylalanyl-tRNA synthetase alpha chain